MKRLLRKLVINLISLKITASLITAISFSQGAKTVILASIMLTLFDHLMKPILKILLFPINLVTMGLLRCFIDAFGLYLVSLIIPSFSIAPFNFQGTSWQGFAIPAASFSLFWTYVLSSFCIGFFITLLTWTFRK